MLLPDQIHINHIRERLWSGRDVGRAAIMVGSGFSRNAVKVYPSAPEFPLWYQLADVLKARLESSSSNDAPRLASEYEVVFGRQSLDDLLISTIPDLQYQPSRLHKLLLSLPWSDIYTTNYDTLLERTTQFVYNRKYDVVLTNSDLPGSIKPRIVKLHGSFPSQRPFIFTEEDYRTYPQKFAPFVNTVQQSIMENIFCLIGFSGEDPNFLNWIGWVRDNLGESTPPIYLCGLLNLSTSQKQLLLTKNITTIDLSPIFPESQHLDRNIQHSLAVEWFLLSLLKGQPINKLNWPSSPVSKDLQKWCPSINMPVISDLKFSEQIWVNPNVDNSQEKISLEKVKKIIENWKLCRLGYPGFIIASKKARDTLWNFTDQWTVEFIRSEVFQRLQESDEIDEIECLSTLYELNWRLEKCLMPLYSEILVSIESILIKINPFPTIIKSDSNSSIITPEVNKRRDGKTKIDWSQVSEQWVTLTFAIIKEARRNRDEEKFYRLISNSKPIINSNIEWKLIWLHEQCLFELIALDKGKLIKILDEWQSLSCPSFWLIKLSCILFEIGQDQKAEETARSALNDVRSRLRPYVTDYSLLSQEGISMMVLETIEQINDYRKIFDISNQDRWEELSLYNCNPRAELSILVSTCEGDPPQQKPQKSVVEEFDPGYSSTTYHYGQESTLSIFRPGYELMLMMEESGISPIILKSSVAKAAQWVKQDYPLWAIEILMRCQDETQIKEYFSSAFIEMLDKSNMKILYKWLNSRLRFSIETIEAARNSLDLPNNTLKSFGLSLEILSRILCRITDEESLDLFNTILNYVSKSPSQQSLTISKPIKSFWQRAFERISNIDILNSIEFLLKINLPNSQINDIDPFLHIKWKNNFQLPKEFDRSKWDIFISQLIFNVQHGSTAVREYSLLRFFPLIEINSLTIQETSSLASALWNKLDNETGLPLNQFQYLSLSALLHFPEVNSSQLINLLRQYILTTEINDSVYSSKGIRKVNDYLDLLESTTSIHLLQSHSVEVHGGGKEEENLIG